MGDHIIGFVTGGISKTIAISSELIAGKKGRDSARARQTARGDEDQSDDDLTQQAWELDAVEQEVDPTRRGSNELSPQVTEEQDLFTKFRSNIDTTSISPLPQAILIPQRRPGDRKRGFVQAYAPVLAETKGIQQEDFLEFLSDFHKASQSSKVFDVINLACFGVGLVPSTICIAVSVAVGTANRIAQETQVRYRTSSYLEKANKEIFMPRNCFAMLMTYKPDMADQLVLQADTDAFGSPMLKSLSSGNKAKDLARRLRVSSGSTTEAQMPECAPLVYPGIDRALASTQLSEGARSSLKNNSAIVNHYLDRRAQTEFTMKNPNSKITQALPPQQSPYVNRFADPNHPVNAGSIFALLSGGTFDPIASSRIRRAEAHAKRNGQPPLTDVEKHDAYMGRKVRGRVTGTPSKQIPIIGKILKKDVLYLIIVEMPTEQQIADVGRSLQL